ncbi:MAG: hydantoinase/oxoprolinase family protein [Bacillota bacterium]
MQLKLGIDVGGTNTDAIIMDKQNNLLGAVKTPTTEDVGSGILNAIDDLLAQSGVDPSSIAYAMIGTTHCTNALIEHKRLATVAVMRIGKPLGEALEPAIDWPDKLRKDIGCFSYIVKGGFEFDGRLLENELDETEIRKCLLDIREKGAECLAISCIFSPVKADHEKHVAKMAKQILGPSFPITVSHEIGSLGLLERENSTILNGALLKVTRQAAKGIEEALSIRNINARICFGQNDGTIMSLDYAQRYPVLTIGSGPTNSIRGAAFLTGLDDCIIVDIGGTSTDIGELVKGFPRESAINMKISGVRTNFRMPEIYSIGLGGGSIVNYKNGLVEVGPDSVGYKITEKSLAWGGDTLTATDIVLASRDIKIQDPKCSRDRVLNISPGLCNKANQIIVSRVENMIEQAKTGNRSVPIVLVGGGSILLPDHMEGVSQIIRPLNYQYANAIGAAIAQISGQVDRIWSLDILSRKEAIEEARIYAVQEAIEAGADPETIEIVDINEIPLAYLPSNAVRIKVKATGMLRDSLTTKW